MLILNIVTQKGTSYVKLSEIKDFRSIDPIKYISLIRMRGDEKREVARYNSHNGTGIILQSVTAEDLLGIGLLNGETVTIKWYDHDGINVKSERQPANKFDHIIPTVSINTSPRLTNRCS